MKTNINDIITNLQTKASGVLQERNGTVKQLAAKALAYFEDSATKAEASMPGFIELFSWWSTEDDESYFSNDGKSMFNRDAGDWNPDAKAVFDILCAIPSGDFTITGTGSNTLMLSVSSFDNENDLWELQADTWIPVITTQIKEDNQWITTPLCEVLVDYHTVGEPFIRFSRWPDMNVCVKMNGSDYASYASDADQILRIVRENLINGDSMSVLAEALRETVHNNFSPDRLMAWANTRWETTSTSVMNTLDGICDAYDISGLMGIVTYAKNFLTGLSTFNYDSETEGFTFTDNSKLMCTDFGAGIITTLVQAVSGVVSLVVTSVSRVLGLLVMGISLAASAINNFLAGLPDNTQYCTFKGDNDASLPGFYYAPLQIELPLSLFTNIQLREALLSHGAVNVDIVGGHFLFGLAADGQTVRCEYHCGYELNTLAHLEALLSPFAWSDSNVGKQLYVVRNPASISVEAIMAAYEADLADSDPFDPTNVDDSANNVGRTKDNDLKKRYTASYAYFCFILLRLALSNASQYEFLFNLGDYEPLGLLYSYPVQTICSAIKLVNTSYTAWNDMQWSNILQGARYFLGVWATQNLWDIVYGSSSLIFGGSSADRLALDAITDNTSFEYWYEHRPDFPRVPAKTRPLALIGLYNSMTEIYWDSFILPLDYNIYFTITTPAFNRGSIVSFCIAMAVGVAVTTAVAIFATFRIRKWMAKRAAFRSAKIEKQWAAVSNATTREEFDIQYEKYRKMVRNNNIIAKVTGGTTYAKSGFWNDDASSLSIGGLGSAISDTANDVSYSVALYQAITGHLPDTNS